MKVIELYSRRAHIALACKWRFPRTEIRGNFLPFQSKNLIHFRRELVNQLRECFRVGISNWLTKSTHHSLNVLWPRIPINLLRKNRPEPFNAPKIIPLCSKKKFMDVLISPKGRSVSWKVHFHKFLVLVRAMRLGKVLLKYHLLVALKEFPLVNRQSFWLFPLLNIRRDVTGEDLVPKRPRQRPFSRPFADKLPRWHCLWNVPREWFQESCDQAKPSVSQETCHAPQLRRHLCSEHGLCRFAGWNTHQLSKFFHLWLKNVPKNRSPYDAWLLKLSTAVWCALGAFLTGPPVDKRKDSAL